MYSYACIVFKTTMIIYLVCLQIIKCVVQELVFDLPTCVAYKHRYSSLMMMSSNGNVTGPCHRWIPLTMSRFDVFFDLRLHILLNEHRDAGDLRRHHSYYDVTVMLVGVTETRTKLWTSSPHICLYISWLVWYSMLHWFMTYWWSIDLASPKKWYFRGYPYNYFILLEPRCLKKQAILE